MVPIRSGGHEYRKIPAASTAASGLATSQVARLADADPAVRREAVGSLVQCSQPAAYPYLVRALKDTDRFARIWAASGLQNLKDRRAVPHLRELLRDPDLTVRYHVVRVLVDLGDTEVALRAAKLGDAELAAHAANVLGDYRAREALMYLVPLVGSSNPYVSGAAMRAVAKIEDPRIPYGDSPDSRRAAERWWKATGFQRYRAGTQPSSFQR